MNKTQPQPVIIGASLSGTAISLILSRNHIPHILIGEKPSDKGPRLGESLDLEGSITFLKLFPELKQYFYSKKSFVGYLGEFVFSCGFQYKQKLSTRLFFQTLGHDTPNEFLHVDRVALDLKMYALSVSSPYCTYFEDRVSELDYDAKTDKINAVTLSNGQNLPCSYVFDGSNYAGVVAKAANINRQSIGDLQRVVFTHYSAPKNSQPVPLPTEPWVHHTSLIRFCKAVDGLDAMAWCIPLNGYVSVGVSMKAEESNSSDTDILNLVKQAYKSRGVGYADIYPETAEIKDIKYKHFIHERAYGANWLLVGTAYCLVWWMSSAGVASSLVAAQLAPRILKKPARVGQLYQNHFQCLLNNHNVLNDLATKPYETLTKDFLIALFGQLIRLNFERMVNTLYLRDNPVLSTMGGAINSLASTNFVDTKLKSQVGCLTQKVEAD